MASHARPLPPTRSDPQQGCAYGAHQSTGWRWFAGLGRWERACDRHRGPRGDYVPDYANGQRQNP